MDTREKIVDLRAAVEIAVNLRRRGERLTMIAAHFDVLTPDHVRRLRDLSGKRPLMVAVLDPPDPLLPSRARAELAASLGIVDYVLLLNGAGLDRAIEQIQPSEVIHDEMDDRRRSQALIEHVHRRHRT